MTHGNAPATHDRHSSSRRSAEDFVWRAGGAIALAAARGEKVTIACSDLRRARRVPPMARGTGKQLGSRSSRRCRRDEAERAAPLPAPRVRFYDAGDYPGRHRRVEADQLVAVLPRRRQPDVVLTHPTEDPYNGDHPAANRMALEARVLAQAIGYPGEGEIIGAPPVFTRAAPARDERLQARGPPRHHRGLGHQAQGDGVSRRPAAPVGLLHRPGRPPGRPAQAQRRPEPGPGPQDDGRDAYSASVPADREGAGITMGGVIVTKPAEGGREGRRGAGRVRCGHRQRGHGAVPVCSVPRSALSSRGVPGRRHRRHRDRLARRQPHDPRGRGAVRRGDILVVTA
ncbi:PIG-L family deacetylase [Streptomyces sp. L7]